MDMNFKIGNQEKTVTIEKDGDGYHARIEDVEFDVQWIQLEDNSFVLFMNNTLHPVYVAQENSTQYVHVGGEQYTIEPVVSLKKSQGPGMDEGLGGEEDKIAAPMPGKIIKILVAEGEQVKKGHNAVILEAMKMETHVPSPQDAIIAKINCAVGDQVNLGDILIELNPDGQ